MSRDVGRLARVARSATPTISDTPAPAPPTLGSSVTGNCTARISPGRLRVASVCKVATLDRSTQPLTWLKRQKSKEFRPRRRNFAAEREGLPTNLIRTCLRANYDRPSLQASLQSFTGRMLVIRSIFIPSVADRTRERM